MAETTYYQSRHTGEEIDNLLDEAVSIVEAVGSASILDITDVFLTAYTVNNSTLITTANISSSITPGDEWVKSANKTVRLRIENQGSSSYIFIPVDIVSSTESDADFHGRIYINGSHIDISIRRSNDTWTTTVEVRDFAARLNVFAAQFTDTVNGQNIDRLGWLILQIVDDEQGISYDVGVISRSWSSHSVIDMSTIPFTMKYEAVFGAFLKDTIMGNATTVISAQNDEISITIADNIIPDNYITSRMIDSGAIQNRNLSSRAVSGDKIEKKAILIEHLSDEVVNKFYVNPSGSYLHDLFVAAGAVWNDTAKNWTVGLVEGISTDKMAAIYTDTNGRLRGNSWNYALAYSKSFTNFPPRDISINLMMSKIEAIGAFQHSSCQIVQLTNTDAEALQKVKFVNIGLVFYGCNNLIEVIGIMDISDCSSVDRAFDFSEKLQSVKLYGLKLDLSLSYNALISLDSLQYLVNNSKNTSAITVTVHADVYAKLTDPSNTEWYAVNEAAQAKQISFATT